jgi:hypothetical protein
MNVKTKAILKPAPQNICSITTKQTDRKYG